MWTENGGASDGWLFRDVEKSFGSRGRLGLMRLPPSQPRRASWHVPVCVDRGGRLLGMGLGPQPWGGEETALAGQR